MTISISVSRSVGLANEHGPALHEIRSVGVDRLPSWKHWLLAKLPRLLRTSSTNTTAKSNWKN
jgi:hypothetical protein